MLERREEYDALFKDFRWQIPDRFNIGTACSNQWAAREPDRTALIEHVPGGNARTLSYRQLADDSDRLASWLTHHGIDRGDRIAIMLPQCFAVAIVHLAAYKLGAIALPLATVFGPEALDYRLRTSGANAIVTDSEGLAKLAAIEDTRSLSVRISIDGSSGAAVGLERILADTDAGFDAVATTPDDPAMMIFTSGTTGLPKGALHGHRVLLGHLPGVQMHHEFLPQPDDRLWTPADWAWAGGLLNVLLPGLYLGVPVVAGRFSKFDPEAALGLVEKEQVRNIFMPPTALRMARTVSDIPARYRLSIRTIGSGGESLGRETFEWALRQLGISINEFYGQTECNLVLSSCSTIGVIRPGAIGKTVPGHRVAIIDEHGTPVKPGDSGQIAVRRPDPVMFLEYWDNPEATRAKFIGDWMTTGDQGIEDSDGYVQFFGRDDDVITSAGYRIGPGEIEDCLTGHPAVALAAAVGKPDPVRTEIVKAYIVLKPGFQAKPALSEEIRHWVRDRLSAHEYPREIEFVDEMPLTTTGKVIRRVFRERASTEAAGQARPPQR